MNIVKWVVVSFFLMLFYVEAGASNKYVNNMKILNGMDDSDSVEIEIKGNGEKCRLSFMSEGTIYSTSCLTMVNSNGLKIYCSPHKRICKTYAEIYNFVFSPLPTTVVDKHIVMRTKVENSKNKTLSWKELGINSPTMKQQWILNGAKTPEEVRKWKTLGMIRPYDVGSWFGNGVKTPEEAKLWINAGFKNPTYISSWKINNVKTPEDAMRWSNVGFGNTPLGKKEWSKLGITTLVEVEKWIDSNIYIKDARHWMSLGVKTPKEVKKWIKLGLDSPIMVERWMDEGIKTPQEVKEWIDIDIKNPNIMFAWKSAGIQSPKEVRQWMDIGITSTNVKIWKSVVETPQMASEWKTNGFSNIEDIKSWKGKGYTAISAKKEIKAKKQQIIDEKKRQETYQYMLKIFLIILLLIVVYGVVLGVRDQAIFYLNPKDLLTSAIPLVVLIFLPIVSSIFEFGNWFNYVTGIVFIVSLLMELNRSYTYNGTLLKAIPITLAKISLSLLALISLLGLFGSREKDGRTSSGYRAGSNSWVFVLILGVLALLANKLINGDRVQNIKSSGHNDKLNI